MASPIVDAAVNPALLSASATNNIKKGNGVLRNIFVSTTGNITVYDGVDATGVKVLNITALPIGVYECDYIFQKGLTIVTGAGFTGTAGYI